MDMQRVGVTEEKGEKKAKDPNQVDKNRDCQSQICCGKYSSWKEKKYKHNYKITCDQQNFSILCPYSD